MPFEIVYTVRDAKEKDATTSIKIPTTFNLADYIEFGQGMATLLAAIARGNVRKAELCLPIDISGYTNNTVSILSDVEEIAAFEFVTAEGNRVKLNIPGCPDGVTLTNDDALDQTDPQVATVITMMTDGLSGTTPCDVGGDDVVDVLFAREASRSSSRRA